MENEVLLLYLLSPPSGGTPGNGIFHALTKTKNSAEAEREQKEITLDCLYLVIDTFLTAKGYFCSFLLSNIYWLTSLSTVSTLAFFLFYSAIHIFFTHIPLAGCSYMWEFLVLRLRLFSTLCIAPLPIGCTFCGKQFRFVLWSSTPFW